MDQGVSSNKTWLYGGVAILVLVGGFFAFRKFAPTSTSGAQTVQIVLSIHDKKIVNGHENTTVKQGDTVEFDISGDSNDEFHLHGYDQSVQLKAGDLVKLTFKADKTGHFPFELEESKVDLGALDVEPR